LFELKGRVHKICIRCNRGSGVRKYDFAYIMDGHLGWTLASNPVLMSCLIS